MWGKRLFVAMVCGCLLLTGCADSKPSEQPDIVSFEGGSSLEFMEQLIPYAQEQEKTLFTEQPIISEFEAEDGMPASVTYEYAIGETGSLIVQETTEDGQVYQVSVIFDTQDEASVKLSRMVSDLVIALLEPNEGVRENLASKLQLDNTQKDASNFTVGTAANWTYIVSPPTAFLTAIAL